MLPCVLDFIYPNLCQIVNIVSLLGPKHSTALTGHLGEAVREVQRQQRQQQASWTVVEGISESAHTRCCVVEALFVHRLRDSFIDKVSSVFSAISGDVIRQTSPNFWPFLLGFLHRDAERLDIALKLLSGIEMLQFRLVN